jgi:phosphatidylserine decarboxylase
MTIHREGYPTIGVVSLFLVVLNLIAAYFLLPCGCYAVLVPLSLLSSVFLIFIISFFRIPSRKLTIDDQLLVAPADGKVVVIEEVFDEEYFKDKRLQVSIFMSPLNVHVNRNPISGEVKYSKYHPGKYLVAWHPKSSTDNERHSVVIRRGNTEILVKQIAGALARRIVNYLQPGQQVEQCKELGFIKFGSRVDLLLPLGTKLNINLNEHVQGGVTVIATL